MKNIHLIEANMLNIYMRFLPNWYSGYREEDRSSFAIFSNGGHIGRVTEKNLYYCRTEGGNLLWKFGCNRPSGFWGDVAYSWHSYVTLCKITRPHGGHIGKSVTTKNIYLKEANMLNISMRFHPNWSTGYIEEARSSFAIFSNSGHIGRATE